MCEHMLEFKNTNRETGEEETFCRCSHVQLPLLVIELNQNIRELINTIREKKNV